MYCIIFKNNTVHGIKRITRETSVRYYEKMIIIVGRVDSYLSCIGFESNCTSHLKYLNNSNRKA
jgi:hypothetical protein